MNQGRIVEYIDQGSFISTICLQDEGIRLHLLTLSNREVNLSPKRALLISGAPVSTLSTREELLGRLKQTEERRSRLHVEVQVKDLWELVREEKEIFDSEYLAELCFGKAATDDHVSALVRALFQDKLYFKMKDGRFLPNSPERVDQTIREREEAALREKNLTEGSRWLKQVVESGVTEEPSCKDTIVELLIELALYGEDAPNLKFGRELLSKAGISDILEARHLLFRLGIWEVDENLDLLRFHVKTSFGAEVLNESQQLAGLDADRRGCEDLRDLSTITIDGPLTKDYDDALSLDILDGVIHLGIHISDVAGLIPPESILDKEAAERGSSLYLPRRQIPMIPLLLSQDALALKQDCDRQALSLVCRFDRCGQLLDYRFMPSLIRVKRQLSYEQVNQLYMHEDMLGEMYRLSQIMRQRRIEQGALILSLPELSLSVDEDSRVSIKMIPQETPSRTMVAEFMILYNWMAARFCRDSHIPILYRAQEEPGEVVPINESDYPYSVLKQRSKLSPLQIHTEPRPHNGLGMEVYTNVTSPIRRYFDLVIQRQIRNALLCMPPHYTREALEQIRMGLEPVLKDLGRLKRNRMRYWVQKYLLQHMDKAFPAIVLGIAKTRYRIALTDFLLVTEMKRQEGQGFSEGQRIMVKIKKADPWNDILRVEYARQ